MSPSTRSPASGTGPAAGRLLGAAASHGTGATWPGLGAPTIVALAVILAVSALLAAAYRLELVGFGGPATISLQLCLAAGLLRLRLPGATRTRALFEGFAALSLIALAAMAFSYGFQLLGFALRDAELAAADHWLGFDQRAVLDFVEGRPRLHSWIAQGYYSFFWQIVLTVAGFATLRRPERMEHFLLAFGMALFATCALSGLLPATSLATVLKQSYSELRFGGASPVDHILALRDGSMRRLEVGRMGGIVSFPSFHVATAAMTTLAWRRTAVLWLLLPLNALLAVGALTEGAHYLVDGVAGAMVGAGAWWCSGRLLRRSRAIPIA
jgi:membrane-associated phospholipid phosphatase